jgi:hypothetical protein
MDTLQDAFTETFGAYNIATCNGEWLDNLGALVGAPRPFVIVSIQYLRGNTSSTLLDAAEAYITNAPLAAGISYAADDQYRNMIRSQICKNTVINYSLLEFESFFSFMFSETAISKYVVVLSATTVNLYLQATGDDFARMAAILSEKRYDSKGRVQWTFPWPPSVTNVVVSTFPTTLPEAV